MRYETLTEWLAWQETLHPQAIDLGLERVRRVADRLQLDLGQTFTITVGGTNGKGSCVAMLETIFREAGYRVGAYTSPHILKYNERIAVSGQSVDDARIIESFDRIDQARGDTTLSFFEFGTLAALDIFRSESLDIQILEVGLGGRLDAVNIVSADIALVASIDVDHQDWLGTTREMIGLEKAGIFRKGRPAVVGDPEVPKTVLDFSEQSETPLKLVGRDFAFSLSDHDYWSWSDEDQTIENLPLPSIPGKHQLLNASAVLEVVKLAQDRFPVSEAVIRRALPKVMLKGRYQRFPGEVPILLDVAHNPQAVRMLCQYLRSGLPYRRLHAVFSVMRDKDIAEILDLMKAVVDVWYLAPLKMNRAAPPEVLADMLSEAGVSSVHMGHEDVKSAVELAKRNAVPGDLILVFGSFFLVSEFLATCA
jgi:dihydrofolate synthase/folylpolyglutamate synthase